MTTCRYLIKWKGYSEDEKTWEPLEVRLDRDQGPARFSLTPGNITQNLSNCTEALNKYEKMKAERDAKAAKKIKATQRAKAKASASQNPDNDKDDDKADDQGLSMKELDARRAQAKEKAKTKSTSRCEFDRPSRFAPAEQVLPTFPRARLGTGS